MSKLWNLLLILVELEVAYWAMLVWAYDGFCYGFSDGKTACSLSQHVEQNHAWLLVALVVYFPHVLAGCALAFLVNDVVFRVASEARTRRRLGIRRGGEEIEPPRRNC